MEIGKGSVAARELLPHFSRDNRSSLPYN